MTEQPLESAELKRVLSEIERNTLESRKLEAEIEALAAAKTWWRIRLNTVLQAVIGGAVAGALIWAFVIDHLIKIDTVAKLSVEASTRESKNLRLEAERLKVERADIRDKNGVLTAQLDQAALQNQELLAKIQEGSTGGTEEQRANFKDTLIARSENLAALQISQLLFEMNGDARATRMAATQKLIDGFREVPKAIDLSLAELKEPSIDKLSASARINVLVFLGRTERSVWRREQLLSAESVIAEMRQRSIGPQTEAQIKNLEELLAAPGK